MKGKINMVTNLKEVKCLAALRSDPDVMQFIKDSITHSIDGYIRTYASDIKKEMGPDFEKEKDIDIYLCLKGPLFYEEGLIIERDVTKKKENVFIFRNIEIFDEPPLHTPKIDKKEIVPGTNVILKAMHIFEQFGTKGEFIPQQVVEIIEKYKDIIIKVESTSDTTIDIYLDMNTINQNCGIGIKNIFGLIYDADPDYIEYDQEDNSIEFEWINKSEIEKMSQEQLEKYFKRFDFG